MLEYQATYYVIDDGWYLAKLLDYPGVVSQGRTLNSARRMIRDALRLTIECDTEQGRPLPRSKPRARDRKAAFQERIRVRIKAHTGSMS